MAIEGDEPKEAQITGLRVAGFKSIAQEAHVQFGKITVLAGANSGGKSSFMQPLLLLKQTQEKTTEPLGLSISGPNASFTRFDQMFSVGNQVKSIILSIDIGTNISVDVAYENINGSTIDATLIDFCSDGEHVICEVGSISKGSNNLFNFLQNAMNKRPLLKLTPLQFYTDSLRFLANGRINEENYSYVIKSIRGVPNLVIEDQRGNDIFFVEISPHVRVFATTLIHVPGIRGNPERSYPTTNVSNHFPGLFTDYTASIIRHWKNRDDTLDSDRVVLSTDDKARGHFAALSRELSAIAEIMWDNPCPDPENTAAWLRQGVPCDSKRRQA